MMLSPTVEGLQPAQPHHLQNVNIHCYKFILSLQDSITSQICKFQKAGTKLGPD